MLHRNTLSAALKKFLPISEGKTDEEILTEIKLDAKGYDDEAADEILAAIRGQVTETKGTEAGDKVIEAAGTGLPPEVTEKISDVQRSVGEYGQAQDHASVLAGIDYGNLKGEAFKKYVSLVGDRSFTVVDEETGEEKQIVGQLRQDQELVFELYKAKPLRRTRYAGVKESPMDFVGIELVNNKPEHTTKIPVKVALEHNAQILNQHSIAGHGKYYLLKK